MSRTSLLLLVLSLPINLLTAGCTRSAHRKTMATAATTADILHTAADVAAAAASVDGQHGLQWARGWVETDPGGVLLRVVFQRSDKCLSVPAGGARLVQYHCHGASYQIWRLQAVGTSFQLVAGSTGQCLHLPANAESDGVGVRLGTCSGQDNQRWDLERAGPRHVRIRSKVSRKCLQVSGRGRGDRLPVVQRGCEAAGQRWRLELAGT